jgi:hypothetical protein
MRLRNHTQEARIMQLRTLFGTATALLALPGVSLAEFNYTNVELSYVNVDYRAGNLNVDGNGFSVAGAYTIGDDFFVDASYDNYDFDFGVDGNVLEVGGGYFYTLNEDLDFIATLSYLETEISTGNFSVSDDGLSLGGGIRAQLGDDFQVDALLKYVNMDEGDSDTSIELRGRYYFSDQYAVIAQFDFGNDFETFSIGIRAEF